MDHVETVPGIVDTFTGINIQDNKVEGMKLGDGGDAIKVLGNATATVQRNVIYGYGASAISAQGVDYPVRAAYYPTVTADDDTIYGGSVRSSSDTFSFFGIGFWSGAAGSADGNTIYNAPYVGYALNAWTPNPVSFTNNTVTNASGAASGYLGELRVVPSDVLRQYD